MTTIEQKLSDAYNDAVTGFRSAQSLWESVRIRVAAHKFNPTLKFVKDWIANQASSSVHTAIPKVKTYFPIREARGVPFERMQMDIMFPGKTDQTFTCILLLIDTVTRYLFAYPMKTKQEGSIITAFSKFIKDLNAMNQFTPVQIDCDNEGGFFSGFVQDYMTENNINLNYNQKDDHLALAFIDRATRTIRTLLNKYNIAHDNTDWVNVLPKLIEGFNKHKNLSTTLSPDEFMKNPSNPVGLLNDQERMNEQEKKASTQQWYKNKIDVGDLVRIPEDQGRFYKKSKAKWKTTPERVTGIKGDVYYYVTNHPGVKYRKYELLPVKENNLSSSLPKEHILGKRDREIEAMRKAARQRRMK